jgi:hypothetical protein
MFLTQWFVTLYTNCFPFEVSREGGREGERGRREGKGEGDRKGGEGKSTTPVMFRHIEKASGFF